MNEQFHSDGSDETIDQPHAIHDQPTVALSGTDAACAVTEPNQIRSVGDYEIVREIARGGTPIEFGLTWFAVLIMIGNRLRNLGKENSRI